MNPFAPAPPSDERRTRGALWTLLLIQLIVFRLDFLGAGYYLDDWWEISLAAQGNSLLDALKAFARVGYWDRPLNMLLLAGLHRLSGVPETFRPWIGQSLLVVLEVLQGWLFFLLARRLFRWQSLALAAAALAMLFPNRPGIHYRITLLCLHFSLVLVLSSLLAHLKWWESGRRRDLIVGQLLFATALLFYESPMLMPLLLAGGIAGRSLAHGKQAGRIAADGAKLLFPYGLSIAVLLLWKWVGMRTLFETANLKASVIDISLKNVGMVLVGGFGCVSIWPLSLSLMRLGDAVRELGWLWLALPFLALWLGKSIRVRPDDREASQREVLFALCGAIVGGFLGTYAPYVLSDAYVPHVNGIMSRVNGTGAWVAGMALTAAMLSLLRPRHGKAPLSPALLLPLLLAFTWTNWVEARAWSEAWRLQRTILSRLAPHAKEIPPSTTLMLSGAPRFIRGAPVFDSDYDLGPALRLTTGRKDISANVVSPRMQLEDGWLVERYRGQVVNRYAPSEFRIYDLFHDRLGPSSSLSLITPPKYGLLQLIFLGPGRDW